MTPPRSERVPRAPTKCLWCDRRLLKGRLFVEWCDDRCRDRWYLRLEAKFERLHRLMGIAKPVARRAKPRRGRGGSK